MRSNCLRVEKSRGEKVRRDLLREGILDLDLRVRSDGNTILLPLKGSGSEIDLEALGTLESSEFEPVERPPRTYKDLIDLPDDLKDLLPSSFDVIGEICLLKIPQQLVSHAADIGKALLEVKRNLKTVALDNGVKGEFRIRDLEVVAGQNDLETIHVENNLRFKLDPSRVYFSPRLATERLRVAQMVEGGNVLDMFAGIGPFSLTIGRHGRPEQVTGIDLNPDCIDYFSSNIKLNSLDDTVHAYLGDSREAAFGMGPFDRIVMNLPHGSMDFLDTALAMMEDGTIHIYSIVEDGKIMEHIKDLIVFGEKEGRKLEPAGMREVHNYSPTQSMIGIDLKVNPNS